MVVEEGGQVGGQLEVELTEGNVEEEGQGGGEREGGGSVQGGRGRRGGGRRRTRRGGKGIHRFTRCHTRRAGRAGGVEEHGQGRREDSRCRQWDDAVVYERVEEDRVTRVVGSEGVGGRG